MGRYSWLRGSRGHALRELVRISLALSLCDPQRMARERPARGRGPYSIGPAPPGRESGTRRPWRSSSRRGSGAERWRRGRARATWSPRCAYRWRSTHLARISDFLELISFSMAAPVILAYLDRSLASSHAKKVRVSLPFFSVYGSRPKWQYAAVTLYLGWHSWRSRARAPGRASKLSLTMLVIDSGVRLPCSVPYVSTKRESGLATPMAYDSCTSARLHRPDLTADLAIQRQA